MKWPKQNTGRNSLRSLFFWVVVGPLKLPLSISGPLLTSFPEVDDPVGSESSPFVL